MKKFKKIYVEITNVCNLSCNFCPKSKRKPEFMTLENFEYIATIVKKHCDYIYLHVKGEPLLHPDINKILDICNNIGLKVCLTTNGILIRPDMYKIHRLNVSLHSFEANNTSLSLDDYIKNITDLINASDFITVLRLWNDGGCDNLNNQIIEKLKYYLNTQVDICKNLKEHIKLKDRCYLEFGQKFDWADIEKPATHSTGFCYGLRTQIAILVDGTVVPCCLDNDGVINLGNIFKTSIQDIYDCDFSQEIINNFSNRKLQQKLCTTCGYLNVLA